MQLQQVVLNLIINAVEAMSCVSEGSRELVITTREDALGGVLVAMRDFGLNELVDTNASTQLPRLRSRLAVSLSRQFKRLLLSSRRSSCHGKAAARCVDGVPPNYLLRSAASKRTNSSISIRGHQKSHS